MELPQGGMGGALAQMLGTDTPANPAPSGLNISNPLALALMQAGLSTFQGQGLGTSFGQGVNTYLTLAEKEAQEKLLQQRQKQDEIKLDLAQQEVDIAREAMEGDKDYKNKKLQLERDKLAADKALKAQLASAKDLEEAPSGIDEKVWNRALQTVQASAGIDEKTLQPNPVQISQVYRVYNTMVGNEGIKAYAPFGVQERKLLLDALEKNPDRADALLAAAYDIYDPTSLGAFQKKWNVYKTKLARGEITPEKSEKEKKGEPSEEARGLFVSSLMNSVNPLNNVVTNMAPKAWDAVTEMGFSEALQQALGQLPQPVDAVGALKGLTQGSPGTPPSLPTPYDPNWFPNR